MWNGGVDRVDAVERVLRDVDADLVALEEANDRSVVERFAERLGYELVYGEANSEFAVAWLSRLPIERSENHRLPVLAKTLLEIQVGGLRLCATHLVHGDDVAQRVREVEAILGVVESPCLLVGDFNAVHPDDVVGEGVQAVDRRSLELVLAAGLTDSYRALHDDRGWTYKSWDPFLRLDYVFAQSVEVTRCDVVETDASDHFALVAEL
ncbi:MAG: endonuclease/exonuclease/phosphatase family protein [Gaiellaceae bacterium]